MFAHLLCLLRKDREEGSGISCRYAAFLVRNDEQKSDIPFSYLLSLFSAFSQVTRPSEPWEFSDGAVYLVRELCVANPDKGVMFFEEMADIARLTHFVQADCLRETIWKQVSVSEARVVATCICQHVLVPCFALTLGASRSLLEGRFLSLKVSDSRTRRIHTVRLGNSVLNLRG